jgi:hypothetical protein
MEGFRRWFGKAPAGRSERPRGVDTAARCNGVPSAAARLRTEGESSRTAGEPSERQ